MGDRRGKDPEQIRRKRDEQISEIRKKRRDELLMKNRVQLGDEDNPLDPSEQILQYLSADQNEQKSKGLRVLEKLLKENISPHGIPFDEKIVNTVVSMLISEKSEAVRLEACRLITNIASQNSYCTKAVIRAEGIDVLITLLESAEEDLKAQAAWALGNITADSEDCRDLVLKQGLLYPLIKEMKKPNVAEPFLKQGTWLVSILCHNYYSGLESSILPQIIEILEVTINSSNKAIVGKACVGLLFVVDNMDENQTDLISKDLIVRCIELLDEKSPKIVSNVLQILGNLVSFGKLMATLVCEAGMPKKLAPLLNNGNLKIQRYTLWCIGNLLIGEEGRIKDFKESGLLAVTLGILTDGTFKLQSEAACIVSTVAQYGTLADVEFMVVHGVIKGVCSLLRANDIDVTMMCLKTIESVLRAAQEVGRTESVCARIEELGALTVIENLQSHVNMDIYQKSHTIIADFFSDPFYLDAGEH